MTERLEERLKERGKTYLSQTAPEEEMEQRLNNALKKTKVPGRNRLIAAVIIFLTFFTYNFDAIAYYGKKLLGYDEVMNGSIRDLNELGKGQEINKSFTFPSGVIVTLNGIMFDENRLIAFYSIESPQPNIEKLNLSSETMKGLFSLYHATSGQGKINEEKTEIKWMHNFETPAFYERSLTFRFSLSEGRKNIGVGEIPFKLDRSKAMGYTIKQAVNRTVKVDGSKVVFSYLTASPTMTLVEGTLMLPEETRENMKTSRNHRIGLDYDLLADGKKIGKMGGGLSSSPFGLSFEGRFEPLPENVQELNIKVTKLPFARDLKITTDISLADENIEITAEGNDILLKKLYTKNNASYLTIVTSEDVLLEKVYLLVDGERVPLEKTISGELQKDLDGRITNERTLEFLGAGKQYQLVIERISYTKDYEEVIDIPIR